MRIIRDINGSRRLPKRLAGTLPKGERKMDGRKELCREPLACADLASRWEEFTQPGVT